MQHDPPFGTLVRALGRGIARLERERICCGEITLQQFETLRFLHEDRARLTTGDLAQRLDIDLSTASRNLAVLERNGYLVRVRDKGDARRITNRLTRKGTRCIESLCCDEESVFGDVLGAIPVEQRPAVLAALSALVRGIDRAASPAANGCCSPTSETSAMKGDMP